MTSFVEIDGKKFQNVGEAARLTGYSRDYVGRLAREKKIEATQVGRQWFVSLPSLQNYAKAAELEMKARQEKLSAQRKQELVVVDRISEKRVRRSAVKQNRKIGVWVTAVIVLVLGIGFGTLLDTTLLTNIASQKQVANIPQSESFPRVAKEFPVATGDVVETQEVTSIDFSQESMTISAMDGDGQGVMLLPSGGSKNLNEKEIQDLFSDPVKIIKDENGNRYVVRTKVDGTEERLPFAVVPVANKEMP